MFKFIGKVFSTTSKIVGTGLNVTTSAVNEINKGLTNVSNYLERKNQLSDIARRVSNGQLSKAQALLEVEKNIGIEALKEFEEILERLKEGDLKLAVFEVFPIGQEEKIPKDRQEVINHLIFRYGSIDINKFNRYFNETRDSLIEVLGKKSDSLSDKELYEQYKIKEKELDEFLKSVINRK